jgi:hypothetical protein
LYPRNSTKHFHMAISFTPNHRAINWYYSFPDFIAEKEQLAQTCRVNLKRRRSQVHASHPLCHTVSWTVWHGYMQWMPDGASDIQTVLLFKESRALLWTMSSGTTNMYVLAWPSRFLAVLYSVSSFLTPFCCHNLRHLKNNLDLRLQMHKGELKANAVLP